MMSLKIKEITGSDVMCMELVKWKNGREKVTMYYIARLSKYKTT